MAPDGITSQSSTIYPPQRQNFPQTLQRWDKAKTYGDPALVPSRIGEHVRQEIAWAGEVSNALRVFDPLELIHVNVNMPRLNSPRHDSSILVTGRLKADFDASEREALEAKIRNIALSIVPNTNSKNLQVILEPKATTSPTNLPPWMWSLVCLGIGASAGTIVERLRQKRRSFEFSRGTQPSKSVRQETNH